MINLSDVTDKHGLSRTQRRALESALEPVLDGQMHKARGAPTRIDQDAVETIEKAIQLRQDGCTWSEVADHLLAKIDHDQPSVSTADHPPDPVMDKLLDELKAMRQELATIQAVANDADLKATKALKRLPAVPDRQPWYQRWFGWLFGRR